MEKIEFEEDAPLELNDTEFFPESKSIPETSPRTKEVDFEIEKAISKSARQKRMKENPPSLKLRKGVPKKYDAKDYILIRCNICDKDMQHAKHEPDGSFSPYALCQHVVFKGVTEV